MVANVLGSYPIRSQQCMLKISLIGVAARKMAPVPSVIHLLSFDPVGNNLVVRLLQHHRLHLLKKAT